MISKDENRIKQYSLEQQQQQQQQQTEPGQIQSPRGILARTFTRPYLMAACDVTFPDIIGGRISCPNDVLSQPQFTLFVHVPHRPGEMLKNIW